MSKIRVRLLGGFEVWHEDRQVAGFESQKARALLAYLLCHRGRTFSRDHLAGLLWPERTPEAARHALRQAVYNLRSTLPEPDDGGPPLLLTQQMELGIHPEAGLWVDVEAFEEAFRKSREKGGASDPNLLTTAAQLYRGDLLAGFFVKDGPSFEEWLVTEQERLRESALEALWTLVESYRRRGEYRFALHYARRLVAIEPLSEEAHRELMRLCVLTGRRTRALAQFEELENLLKSELGVEPLEETRALYESILVDSTEEPPVEEGEVIGPLIPLVGRGDPYVFLREVWQRVLDGEAHLTLITGEAGIGKTRLIKSFLDAGTAQRRALVLKGRCYELESPVAFQPFAEVIRSALADQLDDLEPSVRLPGEVLEAVARLAPDLRDLRPDLHFPALGQALSSREVLFENLARFFEISAGGHTDGDPLVLFLDDLHRADRSTLELLAFLVARLRERRIWIVATYRPGEVEASSPLVAIVREGKKAGTVTELRLQRLGPDELEEISTSLVGEDQAAELSRFLDRHSGGLPLAVAELINYLWDEGILVSQEGGRWGLGSALRDLEGKPATDLDELIRLRIRRLPNSTRRLATLAAVAGQTFEVQLLQKAGDEHMAVVELGLEILLKRWALRQFAHTWTSRRRERDIVMWARGVRRGSFEFAHKRIRSALYQEVNPLRRQAMHGHVATAIQEIWGERHPERLSHHWIEGGQWEKALSPLLSSAARAREALAPDVASFYYARALAALDHLAAGARSEEEAARWRAERLRVEFLRREPARVSFV